MDEESLILAAQQGDMDAFNQLVIRYQDVVYNQALWLMKDRTEAEDMTQETFIKAYKRLSTFRGGSFKAWLIRILINTCKDELRRKKRIDIIGLTGQSEGGEEYDFTDLLMDHGSSIEEQIEKTELHSSLHRYLDALQADHKEILFLVDMLGLEYNEAAEALALPVGTVKSRLARGRVQLRNHLLMKSLSPGMFSDFPNYAGEYASQ